MRRVPKLSFFKLIVLVFLMSSVTLFIANAQTTEEPHGTLRTIFRIPVTTWDPHKDQQTISLTYLNPVYENLLTESVDGETFEPQLAVSWEEDETGVTFNLREGVSFHDGTPFNADAVIANFERVKTAGIPPLQDFLRNVASVEALDDLTVRFNYSEFDSTILLSLSRFPGKMISPAAFPAEGESILVPIGTGPWRFNTEESAEDNSFLVYDVNEEWWGGTTGRPERIEMSFQNDQNAMVDALLAGDVDVIAFNDSASRQRLEEAGMTVHIQPSNGWAPIIIDRSGEIVPELADVRVRRAMFLAINREDYVQTIDIGWPSNQYGFIAGYGFSHNIMTDYNMDAALALMEEAGNPEFTIVMPTYPPFQKRNMFFVSAWAPLGITVELQDFEGGIFPACFSGEFAVALCPVNERAAKHFVENRLLEGGSFNPLGNVNEDIEALYADAENLSADAAEPLYTRMMEIADQEAIVLWTAWGSSPIASNPNTVSGVALRFFYPAVMKYEDVRMIED